MHRVWRIASLVIVLFLSLSIMAHAETTYEVMMKPGDDTVSTHPVEWKEGSMRVHLQNNGKKPIYYYVIQYCAPATDTCPVIVEGKVPPGETVTHLKKVPAARYLFKIDCPTGDCSAQGSIKQ